MTENITVPAVLVRRMTEFVGLERRQDREMLERTLKLIDAIAAVDKVTDKAVLAAAGITGDDAKRAGERLSRGRSIMRILGTSDAESTFAAVEAWNETNGTNYWSVNTLPSRLKTAEAESTDQPSDVVEADASDGGEAETTDPVDVVLGLIATMSSAQLVRVEAAIAEKMARLVKSV